MATATEIQPLIERYYAARLRGGPHSGATPMTPAAVAEAWALVLDDVSIHDLSRAFYEHVRSQDRGAYWPAPADLLRVCSDYRERPSEGAESIGPRACLDCADTGMRTLVQHVWFVETGLRIRQRVAPCDACDRGRRYSGGEAAQGETWRTLARRCWRPQPRPEIEHTALYITGTPHRLRSEDAQPSSPFYAHPSPEETLGETEHAARQREVAMRMQADPDSRVEAAVWAAMTQGESPERAALRAQSIKAARRRLGGR